MAVINKLRNSGIVIFAVIFALAAFIISDLISSYNSRGVEIEDNSVGSINGEQIQTAEFDVLYQQYAANVKASNQGQPLDASQKQQISQTAWDKIFSNKVFDVELDKLGLQVSEDEKRDLIFGNEPHQNMQYYFSPLFKDGEPYDGNKVRQTLTQMRNNPEAWNSFVELTDAMVADIKNQKYSAMIKNSMYTTTLEAENKLEESNNKYTGKIVALKEMVGQNLDSLEVTDSELNSYLKAHKENYKQEKSVDFKYAKWHINPTRGDSLAAKISVADKLVKFRNAKNDTLFLDINATVRVDTAFSGLDELPKIIGADLANAEKGNVYGPELIDGSYSVYKVLDTKEDSIYYYNTSHILFKTGPGISPEVVKEKADELLKELKRGNISWSDAVMQSEDIASVPDEGKIGWFTDNGKLVQEFVDFAKTHSKGQMGITKSQFGYHIIKVNEERTNKSIRYGVLSEKIKASRETSMIAEKDAQTFRNSIPSGEEGFSTQAEKFRIVPSIANKVDERSKRVPGVSDTKYLTDWALDKSRKVNDISPILSDGNNYYVLHITKIREDGYSKLEDVREEIVALVKEEKKNDILYKQIQKAADGAKSIEDIAKNLNTIATDINSFSVEQRNIQNVGNDLKLVGAISGSKKGSIYTLKGSSGAYAFVITEVTKEEGSKIEDIKNQLSREGKMSASQWAKSCLTKMMDVKDMRYRFYDNQ